MNARAVALYAHARTNDLVWSEAKPAFLGEQPPVAVNVRQQLGDKPIRAQAVHGNGTSKPTGFLNTTPTTSADNASPERAAHILEYLPINPATSPTTTIGDEALADALISLSYAVHERFTLDSSATAFVMRRSTAARVRKLALLTWIERHPSSGVTLRQLPVPGLDTKWLETRTGLVGSLLRLVLGSEETDFYALTGLKRAAHRVRIRILCPALRARAGGLGDIEAPVLELAALPISPTAIIAVENQETGAALPDIDGAVAVLKLGNAVSVLQALPWIREAVAIYWGDIDTHGFAMLHRAREVLPQLRSILMDERTLLAHRDLWGMEPVQCPNGSFDLLTPEERSVYEGLRANRWGVRLRMEQERVSWDLALDALHEALRL